MLSLVNRYWVKLGHGLIWPGDFTGKFPGEGKSIGTELDRQMGVKNLPWNLPSKLVRCLRKYEGARYLRKKHTRDPECLARSTCLYLKTYGNHLADRKSTSLDYLWQRKWKYDIIVSWKYVLICFHVISSMFQVCFKYVCWKYVFQTFHVFSRVFTCVFSRRAFPNEPAWRAKPSSLRRSARTLTMLTSPRMYSTANLYWTSV